MRSHKWQIWRDGRLLGTIVLWTPPPAAVDNRTYRQVD